MAPLYASIFSRGLLLALSLTITLNYADQVAGQSVGLDDLPTCANSCASTAAAAASCKLTDAVCLCAHPDFASSTVQCAQSSCTIEDRGAVSGVLDQMCASLPAGSTSSPPSSTSASSSAPQTHTTSGTSHTSAEISPTSLPLRSPLPLSPTPVSSVGPSSASDISAGNSLTTSGSSTLIVQTIDLPQTSAPSSAARKNGLRNVGPALAFLVSGCIAGAQIALL